MTKVVIQMSHLRISDTTTYRRGDIVEMKEAAIIAHGNSVKRVDDVNRTRDGVPEALQKKDALIKSLKTEIAALELDVAALNETATDDKGGQKKDALIKSLKTEIATLKADAAKDTTTTANKP